MFYEELGELMQAVGKIERTMPSEEETEIAERLAHVAEEIADVEIMLEQVKILYGVTEAVADWKEQKLIRLDKRLEAAKAAEGAGDHGV